MVSEQRMRVEEVVVAFRHIPEMRKLVEECYLDEDLLQAAKRFYISEEFRAVMECVFCKGIRAPSLVLDLGGGNGVASLAWAWAGYRSVLVEPDDSDVIGLGAIVPHVRKGKSNISVCAAIGEILPFRDETFDIVYLRQVLHHVWHLERVCAEVYRVLKPRGLFVATREHVIDELSDLEVFLENHPVHRYTGAENARLLREYYDALKRAGFRKIRILGPWESVINYYPTSQSEFVNQCCHAVSKRVGWRIGRYLASRRAVLKFYGWYRTIRDHTAGRLYSFVAKR